MMGLISKGTVGGWAPPLRRTTSKANDGTGSQDGRFSDVRRNMERSSTPAAIGGGTTTCMGCAMVR